MRNSMARPQPGTQSHAQPSVGLAGGMAGTVQRWWRAYWDWRAREATVLILQSLDQRTLHDIGIARSEIESCVHAARSDRRRLYDVGWMWRSAA